jgi:hypothetical protein
MYEELVLIELQRARASVVKQYFRGSVRDNKGQRSLLAPPGFSLLTYHDVFLFNIRPVRALLAEVTRQTMCLYALGWKGPVAPRTSLRQPTGFQVKGKLRRAGKHEMTSCAEEMILLDVLLQLSLITAIEVAARL